MKNKICFVLDTAMGGVPIVVLGQIRQLDPGLFDCSVVLLNFSWRKVAPSREIFEREGIKCAELAVTHSVNKYSMLKRLAHEYLEEADLIVASTRYELTAYGLARLTTPVVLMIHGDTSAVQSMILEFENMVDSFVAISEFIKDWASSMLRAENAQKVLYLPHSIPYSTDQRAARDAAGPLRIAFVGRYNQYKGADYLTTIGERLKHAGADLRFDLVTDGIDEQAFRESWSFNEVTTYWTNVPNPKVLEVLSTAHIILMPSRNEGLPVALIEAMRLGVVPVCSNLRTGFGELVIPGQTGYLVEAGDTEAFAAMVLRLDSDRPLLLEMSARAEAIVAEKFDPVRNIRRYQDLYTSLIGKKAAVKTYPPRYSALGSMDSPFMPDWAVRAYRRFFSASTLSL
jgi:glycosyltransferase involved in cell wall biosynthesis